MEPLRVTIHVALDPGAQAPAYQSEGAAGMDLRATESIRLEPMERAMAPTGLRMAIPEGFEGQVRPRSGLAAKFGIGMVNAPGTIDCDYRGEIKVLLINFGKETVELAKGERIAQLVICPVARAELVVVPALDETQRGDGGFGSTGKR